MCVCTRVHRLALEKLGTLEPRVSVLDDEFDETVIQAEAEEAAEDVQRAKVCEDRHACAHTHTPQAAKVSERDYEPARWGRALGVGLVPVGNTNVHRVCRHGLPASELSIRAQGREEMCVCVCHTCAMVCVGGVG